MLDLDPKAIVLLIGTNDIGNGAKPEDAADNLEAILRDLKQVNPTLPVIVYSLRGRCAYRARAWARERTCSFS